MRSSIARMQPCTHSTETWREPVQAGLQHNLAEDPRVRQGISHRKLGTGLKVPRFISHLMLLWRVI